MKKRKRLNRVEVSEVETREREPDALLPLTAVDDDELELPIRHANAKTVEIQNQKKRIMS